LPFHLTSDQIALIGVAVTVIGGLSTVWWNLRSQRSDEKTALSIQHDSGDSIVNMVMMVQQYITVFMLDLVVTNESAKRTVTIKHYWLEVPWKDDSLRPLMDPMEIDGGKVYRFPQTMIEYPREMIINHRRLAQGKLAPGDSISGLFMVQGTAPIPFDLYKGEFIPVTVVIADTTGKEYRSEHIAVFPSPADRDVDRPLPPNPMYGFPKTETD
jgi:hypothetical protein